MVNSDKKFPARSPERQAAYDEYVPRILAGEIRVTEAARASGVPADLMHVWVQRARKRARRRELGATIAALGCAPVSSAALSVQQIRDNILDQARMLMAVQSASATELPGMLHAVTARVAALMSAIDAWVARGVVQVAHSYQGDVTVSEVAASPADYRAAAAALRDCVELLAKLHSLPIGIPALPGDRQVPAALHRHLHLHRAGQTEQVSAAIVEADRGLDLD